MSQSGSDQNPSPCNQDSMDDRERVVLGLIKFCKPGLTPDEYQNQLVKYKNICSWKNSLMLDSNENHSLLDPNLYLSTCNQHEREEAIARSENLRSMFNRVKKAALSHQKVEVEESITCAICLGTQNSGKKATLNCGHQYHSECLNQWLKNKATCPVCRRAC